MLRYCVVWVFCPVSFCRNTLGMNVVSSTCPLSALRVLTWWWCGGGGGGGGGGRGGGGGDGGG